MRYALLISLLVTVAVLYFFNRKPVDEVYAVHLTNRIHTEVRKLEQEAQFFFEDGADLSTLKLTYPFFIFKNSQLQYWSDNTFVPTVVSVADTFDIKLIKANNSYFLARKWWLKEDQYVVGLVPLYRHYAISNDYLSPEWNKKIFPDDHTITLLEPNASQGISICLNAESCPFKVLVATDVVWLSYSQQITALLLIFLSFIIGAWWLIKELEFIPYYEVRFIALCLALLGIRMVMVKYGLPSRFFVSEVYDPKLFASSSLNTSLGDLMLNMAVVLLLSYYLFYHYYRFYTVRLATLNNLASWVLSIVSALCVLFASLFPFVVIQTIYNNSVIDLDITRTLHFSTPRMLVYTVVIMSGLSTFFFMHAFLRLLLLSKNMIKVGVSLGLALIIYVMVNLSTGQEFLSSLVVAGCYLLAVISMKMYSGLRKLTFHTFAYLFVAIFFVSFNGAVAIHFFNRQDRIENLFRFARNFLVERDEFGEYLLAEMATRVSNDVFIQTRIHTPFFDKDVVRQKIRQFFLPGYFNKYDVEIMLFNSAGEPMDNRIATSLSEVLSVYNQDAFRTQYEHVFINRRPAREVAQQYLVVMPVVRLGTTAGYVLMELSLKKIIPESVYPELLVDNRFQHNYRTQDISYAVLTDGKFQYSAGFFPYEKQFDIKSLDQPHIYTSGIQADGYDHIAVEGEHSKTVIVSSPRMQLGYAIANFSFLMVLGLMIVLVFILVQGIVNLTQGYTLFFSARIQLLMNMAFFIPLLAVSAVTLSLMGRASAEQLTLDYLNRVKVVGEQLLSADMFEKDTINTISLDSQIAALARLARVDINFYDASGFMLSTSQPLIVENGLISRYISANAWARINSGEPLLVETSHVGKLVYDVSYAALRSSVNGKLKGILAIPFFRSGAAMERAQISLVVNILNIFVLIFMVLVVLAYWVSRWLTFPLSFITQSLKRTSLLRINQPLVWKANDEIGMMVKEYNQMLYNLSESKAELEQTQRERTWREIAQQVAHEIKNPLTPMKLTLQQLERTVKEGTLSTEKANKAVTSLLTQVDTLNDIASSFSTFAKMPEPTMHSVDLNLLLQRIIDLHSQSGVIKYQPSGEPLVIQGDEQFLGRTFSNIILNAFQAEQPGENLVVQVTAVLHPETIRVCFRDNGKGMTPEVAERIFFPHFTTKRSGSGLGLAIAKQAIEQMKGTIWFETEVGAGTTFYIEFPREVSAIH